MDDITRCAEEKPTRWRTICNCLYIYKHLADGASEGTSPEEEKHIAAQVHFDRPGGVGAKVWSKPWMRHRVREH